MNMPRSYPQLTIGIPVHNGATHIAECLNNLAKQTHLDFEVIIFENKSTDGTDRVVKDFCKKDSRFSISESETFLSMYENFLRTIKAISGRGTYFALRAYDDETSLDYMKSLTDALIKNPKKNLAVSDVCFFDEVDEMGIIINPRKVPVNYNIIERKYWGTFSRDFKKIMFPASWFYGVYRSGISNTIIETLTTYPNMWAGDRLIVLKYILNQQLIHVPNTIFYCRTGSASYEKYTEKGILNRIKARQKYFKEIWKYKTQVLDHKRYFNLAYFMLCYKTSAHDTTYSIEKLLKSALGIHK